MSLMSEIDAACARLAHLRMSEQEEAMLRLLRRCIGRAAANDPEAMAQTMRDRRIEFFVTHAPAPGSSWVIAIQAGQLLDREEIPCIPIDAAGHAGEPPKTV